MLSRGISKETQWTSRRCHNKDRRLLFPSIFPSRRHENDQEAKPSPDHLRTTLPSYVKVVTDWGKGEVILKVGEQTVKIDINKLMKYPSQASEDLGAINFTDNQDVDACIEEVMMIDEEARYDKLPMQEPTLELKTLPSTLKCAFLDEEKAKPVIISSKLDIKQEEKLSKMKK